MRIAGVLLGGGRSERFGTDKLEARLGARRLVDIACANFLDAGLDPVVFCGVQRPEDPRVLVVAPGMQMIDTLRNGLRALPEGPFAFAPADMPFLAPDVVRGLAERFLASGARYFVPCHGGRRGHPAFAREHAPFFVHGDRAGAREIWSLAGADLVHEEVATADVLFDVDRPEDLAAAGDARARRARLLARGDLRC